MQVYDAIVTRRSIGSVTDERPARKHIEQMLEAATWAPCHHVTNPWRFKVIAGDERITFGKIMARSKIERMRADGRDVAGEEEKLIAKALRSPVIIAIGTEPDTGPKANPDEDVAATAAAIQNMLLTAHALGLGAIWRTGDAVHDPEVARYMGLSEIGLVAGFVYVGIPAAVKEAQPRRSYTELTTWSGWIDG